jgi:AcrR family transcriptional regulator
MARTGRPREFERQAALEAALLLFWKQGYEPTSLNQLKEVMGGISPTSFYAAFGSKEQLFEEVVDLYRSTEGRVTDILFNDEISPRSAIEGCLRQSARMQTDTSHPLGCLIVSGASNCSVTGGKVVELLTGIRRRNSEAIMGQVRRAVAIGDLPAGTDIEGLSGVFGTFLVGISTAARDGVNADDLNRSIDQIMRLWNEASPPGVLQDAN